MSRYFVKQPADLFILNLTLLYPLVSERLVQKKNKNSAVCRRRETKNAGGSDNKATELLVCPGAEGDTGGILSLKKPLQSANGVTKDSVGKALLLSVNRELVLETCVAATRRW